MNGDKFIKNKSIPLKDNEIYIHLKGVRKNINEAKCRDFCKSLISRINNLPTAIQKWTEVYDIKEDEWGNIFRLPYFFLFFFIFYFFFKGTIANCYGKFINAWVPLGIFASAMVKRIIIHAMLPDALRF